MIRYYAEDPAHTVRVGTPALAVVNTGTSPIRCLQFVAFTKTSTVARMRATRTSGQATGGVLLAPRSLVDGGASASFEIRAGAPGNDIVPAGAAGLTLTVATNVAAGQAEGALTPCEENTCSIAPGHSMLFELLDEDPSPYVIGAHVEADEPPASHLTTTLPASGAFTAGSYFVMPPDWNGATFFVAYAAANPSANARPRWRVSWSDGANDYVQPIAESTLDLVAPAASRDVYQMIERLPSAVAQGATVRFVVPIARPPGVDRVRLDLAELGDVARPGSVVVTIVGGRS